MWVSIKNKAIFNPNFWTESMYFLKLYLLDIQSHQLKHFPPSFHIIHTVLYGGSEQMVSNAFWPTCLMLLTFNLTDRARYSV